MKEAKCILDKDYMIGEVDRRFMGSFVEHLGRVVYEGIYEPQHPTADEHGFRKDVIEILKESGISIIRYPGGNFVSGYHWIDGIGPKKQRPKRLELAWHTVEPNEVGVDEFMRWTKKIGTETMMVVNLGTGTPREAANLVEYCNYPSGTYWSDLRRQFGHEEPYDIQLWGLGNEMDGPWQICMLSPEDYGKKARETAKMMKWVSPSIELVVCGSSAPESPTYPEWDRIVLEYTYEYVEYISIHRYYSYNPQHQLFYPHIDDITDISYFPIDLQKYIHTISSTIDFVKAKRRGRKNIYISFDEWGIVGDLNPPTNNTGNITNLADALIYGGILCTLLKNCDKVKVTCQSLLVNVGGLIYTVKGGPAVKNTIFYPFHDVAQHVRRGNVLIEKTISPTILTNHYGETPSIQTASIHNPTDREIVVFAVNYNPIEEIKLNIDFRSFGEAILTEHDILTGEDMSVKNAPDKPDKVIPCKAPVSTKVGKSIDILLPKLSWNKLKFIYQ